MPAALGAQEPQLGCLLSSVPLTMPLAAAHNTWQPRRCSGDPGGSCVATEHCWALAAGVPCAAGPAPSGAATGAKKPSLKDCLSCEYLAEAMKASLLWD